MQLKTVTIDGKTFAEVQDGKPVYTDAEGKAVAFDAPGTVQTISRLNGEAKSHRERAEKAELGLKTYEGLDPAAARAAMDKLSKIDAKKLVEAGDMDAAIKAAVRPFEEKIAAYEKTTSTLNSSLTRAMIGSAFGQSKFAAEKLTPAGVDLIRTMFGDRLKVENDRVVAYAEDGQKLYSKSRPGELADFDEAVERFVDAYPFKEHILRASGGNGGGARPGGAGGEGKTKTASEFNALGAKDRADFMAKGGKLID